MNEGILFGSANIYREGYARSEYICSTKKKGKIHKYLFQFTLFHHISSKISEFPHLPFLPCLRKASNQPNLAQPSRREEPTKYIQPLNDTYNRTHIPSSSSNQQTHIISISTQIYVSCIIPFYYFSFYFPHRCLLVPVRME